MAEKGMVYCAEMVRAFLDGRKTRSMRIIKDNCLQSIPFDKISPVMNTPPKLRNGIWQYELQETVDSTSWYKLKPKFQVGDTMYVREAFLIESWHGEKPIEYWLNSGAIPKTRLMRNQRLVYRATDKPNNMKPKWRPSIHMPKWAARIRRKVVKVEVQRPQDLTTAECIAEGYPPQQIDLAKDMVEWWKSLWNKLHGSDAWERNEWCYVYHFGQEKAE